MKLNIDKSTKDLLVNLVFSLIVAVCCVLAYDRFFVQKLPKIYVVDVQKLEDELRKELTALSINQNGMRIDEDYILARTNEISSFIEQIAKKNKALIFHKEQIIVDGLYVKDISPLIIEMYKNLRNKK